MALINRFRYLSRPDQALLLQASVVLLFHRCLLRFVPFALWRNRLGKPAVPLAGPRRHAPAAAQIGWAVTVASRRLGNPTCLAQALTAQMLLLRYGYTPWIRLGVRRGAQAQIEAHAWVECDGQAVLGGPGEYLDSYQSFLF